MDFTVMICAHENKIVELVRSAMLPFPNVMNLTPPRRTGAPTKPASPITEHNGFPVPHRDSRDRSPNIERNTRQRCSGSRDGRIT